MDEKTKKEWQELQNELAELNKTFDESENWMKIEGAELEDMLHALAEVAEKEEASQLYRLQIGRAHV